MDHKMQGVLLGIGGLLLWFTPFVYIQFMGVGAFQSGQHIGGIAYLLLLCSISFAALSWLEQYQLAVVAAGVATAICLLFAVQAGPAIAWGLIALLILSALSAIFALRNRNQGKQPNPAANG